MVIPGGGSIQIVRSATAHPAALAAFVGSPDFLRLASVLKEDTSSAVFAVDLPAELAVQAGLASPGRVVVKVMVHDRPFKHFLQRSLNTTRHIRQWDGSETMQGAGIPAQKPLLLFRSRNDAGQRSETLVLEWLAGETLLHHMARRDLTLAQEHAVADALGEVLGRMMSKGVVPDDIKPSNIVVTEPSDTPTFAFLDTAGADASDTIEDITPELRCVELVLEPLGVGCLPRRALLWRALRSVAQHYHPPGWLFHRQPPKPLDVQACWKAIEAGVRAHGDPTPKVNPLAPSRRAVQDSK